MTCQKAKTCKTVLSFWSKPATTKTNRASSASQPATEAQRLACPPEQQQHRPPARRIAADPRWRLRGAASRLSRSANQCASSGGSGTLHLAKGGAKLELWLEGSVAAQVEGAMQANRRMEGGVISRQRYRTDGSSSAQLSVQLHAREARQGKCTLRSPALCYVHYVLLWLLDSLGRQAATAAYSL